MKLIVSDPINPIYYPIYFITIYFIHLFYRYWEHTIRGDKDYAAHVDYYHINPLKHGLVKQVADWPYSSFHALVKAGVYPANWAGGVEESLSYED